MNVVTPQQVGRILETTDRMGLHREAIRIPLETIPDGAVRLEGEQAVIEVPIGDDLDGFLDALPEALRALPGFDTLRPAEDAP